MTKAAGQMRVIDPLVQKTAVSTAPGLGVVIAAFAIPTASIPPDLNF